jgi:C4-dicarboxylate-specific signal transduction histidine kinase
MTIHNRASRRKESLPRGTPPTAGSPPTAFEQQLREMNAALLESLVRQQESAEQAREAERKLHDEELVRQRQLDLTTALRVSTVGELAAGLGHELNQPLSAIANMAEACIQYVQAGTIETSKLLELLSAVASESLRAAEIVRHLRSLVDKGESQLEPVDLREIVGRVPQLLCRELERNRITLRIELPARPLRVDADRIQIEQVLVNLLQNAMESILQADGLERLIELRARSVDGMATTSVRDTGIGVSDTEVERMFEAFFTTKPRGLGIGLALSRSILEVHSGRMWIERPSDGGPGTVVGFSIPLARPIRRRKVETAGARSSRSRGRRSR